MAGRRPAAAPSAAWITVRLPVERERPHESWGIVRLTPALHEKLGGAKARIPIAGTANGFPIRTSFTPRGGGHYFVFTRAMQEGSGKQPGDTVTLRIRRDDAPRTIATPKDLSAALARQAGLATFFEALSYSHRKEYIGAIEDAKRPETRTRRIAAAVEAIGALAAARSTSRAGRAAKNRRT